jgi:hypothetical protein
MSSQTTERVVKRGTFLYGGSLRCAVEIVQTDFRPGTGDYEDPEEAREDAHGLFFDIRYASAGPRQFSSGVAGFESLEAAVSHVETSVADVCWE